MALNPFALTVEVYRHPGTIRDAAGIAEIYNYYIEKIYVPEDQARISIDDAKVMVINAQDERLPSIVVIRGRPGVISIMYEAVIGSAKSEAFCHGQGSYEGSIEVLQVAR